MSVSVWVPARRQEEVGFLRSDRSGMFGNDFTKNMEPAGVEPRDNTHCNPPDFQ